MIDTIFGGWYSHSRRRKLNWLTLILLVVGTISFVVWNATTSTTTTMTSVKSKANTGLPLLWNMTNSNYVIGPDKDKHCRRVCPQSTQQNLIQYTCLHPAGLLDRREILDDLIELAVHLCATIQFTSPAQAFHPMHNHQQHLDSTLDWTDFFIYDLVEMEDEVKRNSIRSHNVTVQQQYSGASTPLLQDINLGMDYSFYNPFNGQSKPMCRRPRRVVQDTKHHHSYGVHLMSKTPSDILRDFDKLVEYSFDNTSNLPFLWQIPTNYYTFHKELRQHLIRTQQKQQKQQQQQQQITSPQQKSLPKKLSSCLPWIGVGHYVRRSFPPNIEKLIQDIWNQISTMSIVNNDDDLTSPPTTTSSLSSAKQQSLIGFIHIRRGDTIDECNTTISKLQSYLECSLSNIAFHDKSTIKRHQLNSITILVSTNEENAMYMQQLQVMIDQLEIQLATTTSSSKNKQQNNPDTTTIMQTSNIIPIQMINMESFVYNYMKQQSDTGNIPRSYLNNVHIFMILDYIMNHRVDFKLKQRRSRYCNDCDPIIISK